MSWDIFVMRLPEGITSIGEIPPDFAPPPLGSRDDLVATIQAEFPEADFSNPAWGQLNGDGYLIEFNMGEAGPISEFTMLVRGGGDAAYAIASILDRLGVQGLDGGTEGGIFSLEASGASWERWQAYRDQVVGRRRP